MYSNFLLGDLRITEGAKMRLKRVPYDLIARHAVNDHGQLSPTEAKQNQLSMKTVGTIMSRFKVDPTDKHSECVLVVTAASWDKTTVKLESEI